MADDQIFKEIGEIYARLFDHRPILQGEINYFISEFETKRKYREETRMQKSLEYVREISEKLTTDSKIHLDENLPKITANFNTATEMVNMLLEREDETANSEKYTEQKSDRTKDWTEFMDIMCDKSAQVDREYEDEIKRVTDYYRDLEEKLNLSEPQL